MSKVLINKYGDAFSSKKFKESSSNDNLFIWKQNISGVRKIKLKNEFNVYKRNRIQSKYSKVYFGFWKKHIHTFVKNSNKQINKMEKTMIVDNLLIFDHLNNKLNLVVNKDLEKSYEKLISSRDNKIIQIEKILKKIVSKVTLANKNIKNIISNRFIDTSEFDSVILEINNKFNKEIIKFQDGINNIDKISKQDPEVIGLIDKKIKLSTKIKKTIKKQSFNKEEKLNIIENILVNDLKYKRNKEKYSYLEKEFFNVKTDTFNNEFKYNELVIYKDFSNEVIALKKQFKNSLLKEKNNLIKDKEKHNHEKLIFKKELANLKNDKKNIWKNKLLNLKSNNISKRAMWVERKKHTNELKITSWKLKLKTISNFKNKNNTSSLKIDFRNKLKLSKKIRDSEISNNISKIPVEITNKKYWLTIIIGSLFPGINSLMNKQWIKGILQTSITLVAIIALSWIFGAFPSWMGNGIVGLKKLGFDPGTSGRVVIGMTNGVANDGRFYLVLGALASIVLAIVIVYWLISILSIINFANVTKLGVRQSNWKQQKHILKTTGLPYLLSIPALIFIIFVVVIPLLSTLLIAFTNFQQLANFEGVNGRKIANGISKPISWVGFDQFKYVFKVMGPEFSQVFSWTLIWTFGSTLTLIFFGTLFALVVNQPRIRFKTFFRIIYILPWAVPGFITIMFFAIFFKEEGIFNTKIGKSLFGENIDWKASGIKTKVLMIFMQGWLGHSYIFLLITGMLQSIPKSLYEAARIDGSKQRQQFTTITVPIIISQIAPLLIGQFVFNFNNFGLIYLFNEGGSPIIQGKKAGEQDILISWIYKLVNDKQSPKAGAAAAISLIISIFTVTPSAILFLRSKSFRKGDF